MENDILLHSVQIYWNSIVYAMETVVTQMENTLSENPAFNEVVNNIIMTAQNCSNLYGLSIRDKNYRVNYTNNEMLFYYQLTPLIENQEFLIHLQNAVNNQLIDGERFFDHFLRTIHVNN